MVRKKSNPKLVITSCDEKSNENDDSERIKKPENIEENDNTKSKEILNLDYLIDSYKQQAEDTIKSTDANTSENDSDEEEREKEIKVIKREQTKEKKVKSVTIKNRHQLARERKMSKILLPVIEVIPFLIYKPLYLIILRYFAI